MKENDKFEEWLNSKDHGIWPTIREVEFARKAWNAGIETTKIKRFKCVYNCQLYDDCALDLNGDETCDRMHLVARREDCSRWREIEG